MDLQVRRPLRQLQTLRRGECGWDHAVGRTRRDHVDTGAGRTRQDHVDTAAGRMPGHVWLGQSARGLDLMGEAASVCPARYSLPVLGFGNPVWLSTLGIPDPKFSLQAHEWQSRLYYQHLFLGEREASLKGVMLTTLHQAGSTTSYQHLRPILSNPCSRVQVRVQQTDLQGRRASCWHVPAALVCG